EATPRTAIPAKAIDLDTIGGARRGRDVQVKPLTRHDADLRGIPLDRPPRRLLQLPGRRSRTRVFPSDHLDRTLARTLKRSDTRTGEQAHEHVQHRYEEKSMHASPGSSQAPR